MELGHDRAGLLFYLDIDLAANNLKGKICQIHGPVIDIEFAPKERVPQIYNALLVDDSFLEDGRGKPRTLEVLLHLGYGVVRCLSMDPSEGLTLGMSVIDSGLPITIPVGKNTLGRLLSTLGEPLDELGPIIANERRSIHHRAPEFDRQIVPKEVLETGIKAIDLLCPFVKGGKNCLLGGAGVGKTLLLTELVRNITVNGHVYGVFAGIGERIREAHEVWSDLKESGVLSRSCLVFGCMSEPPGARFRAGLAALTMAEYLEEISGEVLLFVDNISRFAQAGSEVSAIMGRLPGPMGSSPTMESDMGEFQERIATTLSGSMTSIQTSYLPADDPSDPTVLVTLPHMDAVAKLSRQLCEIGIFPAIDPLSVSSELLQPEIVGEKHFRVACRVQEIIQRQQELQDLIAVLGTEELTPDDQLILARARKLTRFLSQPLAVAQPLTGRPGVYVPLAQTVDDVAEIVDGTHDSLPEQAFYMVGTLDDATRKAADWGK